MLDPASGSAALAAMGLYVYLSVAIAAMDGGGKPQVFVETRPAPPDLRKAVDAVADAPEEVFQARGHMVFNEQALQEGPSGPMFPGSFDSAEKYFFIDSPKAWTSPRYIVGWKPVVSQHTCPDGSPVELVHHMNVHAVPAARFGAPQVPGSETAPWADEAEQLRFVASYDRGSGEYRLPPGYGIEVGPGGRASKLGLEYHLLKPHCWDFAHYGRGVDEHSGFDLFVTAQRPPKIAAIMGFTDTSLLVQAKAGGGVVTHVTELPLSAWDGVPMPLELIGVHLHTHDQAVAKQFHVKDAVGVADWSSPVEHMPIKSERYGPTQTMKNLADMPDWPKIVLTPKSKMQFRCSYDTDKLQSAIVDGTSWGQEMCAFLFMVGMPHHTAVPALPADHVHRPYTILSGEGGYNLGPSGEPLRAYFGQEVVDADGVPLLPGPTIKEPGWGPSPEDAGWAPTEPGTEPSWRRTMADFAASIYEGFRRLI